MSIQMSEKEKMPTQYIFGAIFAMANRMQLIGDNFHEEITTKQWFLLAVISKFTEEPPTLGQIASVIGTSRQNVKKMAMILEKEGFVELRKDEKDGRILRVSLTKKCAEMAQREEQRDMEFLVELFDGMDDKMLDTIYQGFRILESNIIKLEAKYGKKEM
ncbi:MAG: MarR family transcriptional regulator [Clostridiales bacterium]|nr:MarR family transcriptional regulator [Clostridiales bacterium]